MEILSALKIGCVVLIVLGVSIAMARFDIARQRERMAWLRDHHCLRTGYHADSLNGIWSCPDGQVYMLRDVPR